jgi:hypothetical protein
MRIMDLPGWPPQPSGPFARGSVFPISTDDVYIERVVHHAHDTLMFACKFGKESVVYHFRLLDSDKANKVGEIIHAHIGDLLSSIAFVEIPPDQD